MPDTALIREVPAGFILSVIPENQKHELRVTGVGPAVRRIQGRAVFRFRGMKLAGYTKEPVSLTVNIMAPEPNQIRDTPVVIGGSCRFKLLPDCLQDGAFDLGGVIG